VLTGFNPQTINDLEGARQAIGALLNLVEELKQENQRMREEIQQQRAEINRLKGEQGRPEIKAKKPATKHSSEKEREQPKQWQKGSKQAKLRIDREEKLSLDRTSLPSDAEFKGYEAVIVQDIQIRSDNVRFLKESYYSPAQKKSYLAALPAGYSGQFGPGVRALLLSCYFAYGMTEPKISEFLSQFGIWISSGQISNLLIQEQGAWHTEKAAIVRAGLASTNYQHMDDTATRVNGEHQYCHVLCNPWYTAYFTYPAKDRLTVIQILQGATEVQLLLTAQTQAWLDLFHLPRKVQQEIAGWSQNTPLKRSALEQQIAEHFPALNPQQKARILEAAALTAYYQQPSMPIVAILQTDDAPQFQQITHLQNLCWIHEGRHYKKLTPFVDFHRQLLDDFLKRYWDFYHLLLAYRQAPDADHARTLRCAFAKIFTTVTGYTELDNRIAKTFAKKDKLLLVLDYPELLLHNNPAELAARQRVRKRDISFGPRTEAGREAWDTFMTLFETTKKLNVNFFDYLYDRVSAAFSMISLADLISQRSLDPTPTF
jgi:transposase IS66 family protein